MKDFFLSKLVKFGGLFFIAFVVLGVTGITRLLLGWFGHGAADSEAIGRQIGEYAGKGLLGFVVIIGFIVMGRELAAEIRRRSAPPPPLPPSPPPLRSAPVPGDQRK